MDEMENFSGDRESESGSTPGQFRHGGGEALIFFWEVIRAIIISLVIIIPIRYFVVQPFFVKGPSMQTTFQDGDYVLIDELSYRFADPQRGDVVIFVAPPAPDEHYIKRVIGLPGETVQVKNNQVTIFNRAHPSGFVLHESYLDPGQVTLGNDLQKLDENEYYVMGDNRLHSSDSRAWGLVQRKLITGRVFFRALPFANIGTFSKVEYQ